MKYSYKWLKELSGTKKSPQEVAELLTMKALEVEDVQDQGSALKNVVVGEILDIQKHPNADRLQVTHVSVGPSLPSSLPMGERGEGNLQIVCGAHNISVGDHVPVAMIGAVLPNGLEIKQTEIRGVQSFGMLCAADELGLGDDHSGILLLPKDSKIGSPAADVLGLGDVLFEIKVLPDRAHDAMSHVGLAREIAALEGRTIDYDYDGLTLSKKKTTELAVTIEDSELSSRYIGVVMDNVEVIQSPQWIKDRLAASGIRAINAIVDATNLVMLELGQPLHAFDFEKIQNQSSVQINIRKAKDGEEIKILDGSVRRLAKEDIVIANGKEGIALAGIMGGEKSGVTEKTTKIILEAAHFHPTHIRQTRTRLSLPTDAAIRFEKGLDPNLPEKAMVRLIEILEHTAGGTVTGVVDEYPHKVKSWTVKLDLKYLDALLGISVPKSAVKEILSNLGIKVNSFGSTIKAEIPTFRLDLQTQEDLIEEVGRIFGYDKVPVQAPLAPVSAPRVNSRRVFERKVKSALAAQGYAELYNYAFYAARDAALAQFGAIDHVELENPDNPDQALMRISLIPNILKNVRENLKSYKQFKVFEIGRVFLPARSEAASTGKQTLPIEKQMLVGGVVVEKKNIKEFVDKREESVFFDVKQSADDLLERLGVKNYYYDTFDKVPTDSLTTLWHQSRSARIMIEGSDEPIGFVGEINPFVLSEFDIHTRIGMFEISMEKLAAITVENVRFAPLRRFPAVVRDLSLQAQRPVRVAEIEDVIKKQGGSLVVNVEMFDAFSRDGKDSYAFHITLAADDRTLKSEEVDAAIERVVAELNKKLDLTLRK